MIGTCSTEAGGGPSRSDPTSAVPSRTLKDREWIPSGLVGALLTPTLARKLALRQRLDSSQLGIRLRDSIYCDARLALRRLRGPVIKFESDRPRKCVLGWKRGLLGGREIVSGDGDRLGGARECVSDDGLVLVGDQKHPDRGVVLRPSQPVFDEGNIEAELARVSRFELRGLELDDYVPELVDVEEQQVDEEVIAVDIEVDLAANEREAAAELAESIDDALDEAVFQSSLDGVSVDREELQREWILGDLLCKLGVGAVERVREVGRGRTLTEVQPGLIWCASTGRLQPCTMSFALYQSRNSASSSFSSSSMT